MNYAGADMLIQEGKDRLSAKDARIRELEGELFKCQQNRASNLQTIKRLETALRTVVNDPVLDTDTQRLLRAHKIARDAIGCSTLDRGGEHD